MSNLHICTRCKAEHWQDSSLCFECLNEEAAKANAPLIEQHRRDGLKYIQEADGEIQPNVKERF